MPHDKQFKIFIDTREVTVEDDTLSYEAVLALKYGAVPQKQENVTYEIMYHHADAKPAEGDLFENQSVRVKNNTSFDVTRTIRS